MYAAVMYKGYPGISVCEQVFWERRPALILRMQTLPRLLHPVSLCLSISVRENVFRKRWSAPILRMQIPPHRLPRQHVACGREVRQENATRHQAAVADGWRHGAAIEEGLPHGDPCRTDNVQRRLRTTRDG